MTLTTNHDIAGHIYKPTKPVPFITPRSSTWTHMIPVIGSTSILGREWPFYELSRTPRALKVVRNELQVDKLLGPDSDPRTELADLESRIIIAIIARMYDFIKMVLGEAALDEKGLPTPDKKG
ncbi:hypothetical protein M434DRAFT_390720 [Hypoxylon sp. CO27-5]|nr:hypothetical protein M434DRAFT_390720 [Hypoxylon sp. CO27-5]